jgi:hypothetical protein
MYIYSSHGGVIVLSRHSLICSANIYLNRTYLEFNLTPNFAHTRINSYNKALAKHTEAKVHKLRVKNKIKFWYAKKQNLNKILYQLHIKNGKQWGNLWDLINQNNTNKLDMKMSTKYRGINNKNKKTIGAENVYINYR